MQSFCLFLECWRHHGPSNSALKCKKDRCASDAHLHCVHFSHTLQFNSKQTCLKIVATKHTIVWQGLLSAKWQRKQCLTSESRICTCFALLGNGWCFLTGWILLAFVSIQHWRKKHPPLCIMFPSCSTFRVLGAAVALVTPGGCGNSWFGCTMVEIFSC